ncbi:MAG: hypothetical protein IJ433_04800 [Ruminococcus sp.]|nr:hypothetical protein [Ruminococcus sp.]
MVKKLFKHEFYAYLRTMLPMHIILLGIALLGRFVQLFENDSTAYSIVFVSSVIVFIVGAIVCTVLTLVFGIRRFHTNLFSCEGYLSFTLPVTPTQHIWVKNIVAVIAQLVSLVTIALATCVITLGDVCNEIFKAFFYITKSMYAEIGFNTTLFTLEFIVFVVLAIATSYMLFYACIALGQRAKKNRIGAAIGVFFIYYFVMQILSTIGIIILAVFEQQLRLPELFSYLEKHPVTAVHLVFGVSAVVYVIGFTIFYLVTRSSIKNKLNLE